MGKSMRAKRLKRLLCKGWVHDGAQQSSAKSGMNGGARPRATKTTTGALTRPSHCTQAWTSRAGASLHTTR